MKTKLNPFFKKKIFSPHLKERLYTILFESDTWGGKFFDITLLVFIIGSISIVMLDSLYAYSAQYSILFDYIEWGITLFFTLEYLLRVYCSPTPKKYIFSFYGMIDLASTLPLYISVVFGGGIYLIIIRAFRLIRIFRIFRLFSFISEGNSLLIALRKSSKKILVFFLFVVILTITIGTLMYLIEGGRNNPGFDNIFSSIYWTIVTLTTVGYGDITPMTSLGKFLSALIMLLGYTIIAVPTGIVSASIIREKESMLECKHCQKQNDIDALFCNRCGKTFLPDQ